MALPEGMIPIDQRWLDKNPLAQQLRERVFYAGTHPELGPDYHTNVYRQVAHEFIQRGLLTEEGLEECRKAGMFSWTVEEPTP